MKYCSRCLLPETQETINFDKNGVCNVCQNWETKNSKDWVAQKEKLTGIANRHRRTDGSWDCIVPFSGGKDSAFTVYYVVEELGLEPLLVTFDHGFFKEQTLANVEKIIDKYGLGQVKVKLGDRVQKNVMLESLRRKGDFCWHCHCGCFSTPMNIAVKQEIPLVIWGEPSAEYTSYYNYKTEEVVDEKRFNRFVNLGITVEDMVGMTDTSDSFIEYLKYPPVKDLTKIGCESICLGSYIPWDTEKQSNLIANKLDWVGGGCEGIPPRYWYEKVECKYTGVRDYLKYIKRGFGRTAHLVSLDLRRGRMGKEEAKTLIHEYDGKRPDSLDDFLRYLNITEREFLEIAVSQAVYPHQPKVEDFLKC